MLLADCFVAAGTSEPAGPRSKLPGALPVIDATEYSSLQGAIDALPSTGGGVRVGPASGRITICANNFSDSFIGADKIKRTADDREASGLTLDGAKEIAVVGNLFSSLRPKALAIEGKTVSHVLFTDNVLVDAAADSEKLSDSVVKDNLSR